jgi:hypothetical protein
MHRVLAVESDVAMSEAPAREWDQLHYFKDMLIPGVVARLGHLGEKNRDIRVEVRGDGNIYLVEVTRKQVLLTESERKAWPTTGHDANRRLIDSRVISFAQGEGG